MYRHRRMNGRGRAWMQSGKGEWEDGDGARAALPSNKRRGMGITAVEWETGTGHGYYCTLCQRITAACAAVPFQCHLSARCPWVGTMPLASKRYARRERAYRRPPSVLPPAERVAARRERIAARCERIDRIATAAHLQYDHRNNHINSHVHTPAVITSLPPPSKLHTLPTRVSSSA